MWALLILVMYFAPAITAYERKVDNKTQVLIVNLFLGWTIIGWVVALVMSYKPVKN